mmetsp:Transcript_14184/g.16151  ORF Transcript_14184/g.16151 Transcript_14184/m.16151 type:complete len:496 (+) Transcript_14184:196-1683(+)
MQILPRKWKERFRKAKAKERQVLQSGDNAARNSSQPGSDIANVAENQVVIPKRSSFKRSVKKQHSNAGKDFLLMDASLHDSGVDNDIALKIREAIAEAGGERGLEPEISVLDSKEIDLNFPIDKFAEDLYMEPFLLREVEAYDAYTEPLVNPLNSVSVMANEKLGSKQKEEMVVKNDGESHMWKEDELGSEAESEYVLTKEESIALEDTVRILSGTKSSDYLSFSADEIGSINDSSIHSNASRYLAVEAESRGDNRNSSDSENGANSEGSRSLRRLSKRISDENVKEISEFKKESVSTGYGVSNESEDLTVEEAEILEDTVDKLMFLPQKKYRNSTKVKVDRLNLPSEVIQEKPTESTATSFSVACDSDVPSLTGLGSNFTDGNTHFAENIVTISNPGVKIPKPNALDEERPLNSPADAQLLIEPKPVKWRAVFNSYDENSDGVIDRQEFANAIGGIMNEKPTARQLERLFLRLDVNRSGYIEFQEFSSFMNLVI